MRRSMVFRGVLGSALSGCLAAGLLVAPHAAPRADAATTTTRVVSVLAAKTAYVDKEAATKSYSNPATAKIGLGRYITYVRFAPVKLAANEKITAASLIVKVKSGSVTSSTGIYAKSTSWNGKTITYNTRPSLGTVVSGTTKAVVGKSSTLVLKGGVFASISGKDGLALGLAHSSTKYRVDINGTGSAAPILKYTITTTAPAQYSNTVNDNYPPVDVSGLSGHSAKLVFAHYMPQFPISVENADPSADYYVKNWLTPTPQGETQWARYGGWLRDRPVPQNPVSGDYLVANALTEVRQAKAAGIDGFGLQLGLIDRGASAWARTEAILKAAAIDGTFKIMLQPDVGGTDGTPKERMEEALAYLTNPSKPWAKALYRDASGRVVLSPYQPERSGINYWKYILASKVIPVKTSLLPVFLPRPTSIPSDWLAISIGLSYWGDRSPQTSPFNATLRSQLKSANKLWMEPVAVQDNRPSAGVFTEAGNSGTLRATWNNAISANADLVLLATWNDYSESTQFAPSIDHGSAVLDLSGYYLSRFKTGSWPAIAHEGIFLSHRIQPWRSQPTVSYPTKMSWVGWGTSPRDTVEVVSMLKASAEVRVTIGGKAYVYTAPAGVSVSTLYPLESGRISAAYFRNGVQVDGVVTTQWSSTVPKVQDLDYLFASSLRPLPRQK